ncbi:class I and II aminotransferase [Siphonobacter sp. SORGH_AS_0500]|uniref:pyridoxal phosphate-dependent aminotransferase n=1 Tax=Siphonobacter sp. SORGH_AS_0500 TaxID=1864824 RepID=UPI000CA8DD2E|nr:aminotransferase class I/II-fold pyridoxal phosphate-dependent enzyme [Siphonobacter sp. SORGH_AS_0500]PKK37243.1 class I and II aminotransferase [Siphonobacter sp. SORGH_AS_0500]
MLEGHGDDGYRFSGKIRADFSTNVWYGGEPVGLKAYLFDRWEKVNRYPEVLAESLSERIAQHHQLSTHQVLVNSGSTESIYLIAQAFAGAQTTIITPAFAEYEDACTRFQHQLQFVNWSKKEVLPQSDLVFICNPNNPTGAIFSELEKWLFDYPSTLFVVDEAFIDFTKALASSIHLLAQYSNLIILRSLTKTYAIPGLRLGYVLASPGLIDRLKYQKQPWTVNTLALEAGHFIFEHFNEIQIPLLSLLADKESFVQALKQIEFLEVEDSETHFFLVKTRKDTAAALKSYLLEEHGLLIRNASNFRDLSPQHFRLATLRPSQNQLLLSALHEWF